MQREWGIEMESDGKPRPYAPTENKLPTPLVGYALAGYIYAFSYLEKFFTDLYRFAGRVVNPDANRS